MRALHEWVSQVWIISPHGVCLFHAAFQPLPLDPDLFSGFILANLTFGRELGDQEITAITFKRLKIHVRDAGKFVVAAGVTGRVWRKHVNRFLEALAREFAARYGATLAGWGGNCAEFASFRPFVTDLVTRRGALAVIRESVRIATRWARATFHKTLPELSPPPDAPLTAHDAPLPPA